MIETRDLQKHSSWKPGVWGFWKKSAVINYLYAKKHGYDFEYVRVASMPEDEEVRGWRIQAIKPYLLKKHISSQLPRNRDMWGMFLDSDVVPGNVDVPLEHLYENIARQICHGKVCQSDVGLVVELEEGASSACVNTGVLSFGYNEKTVDFLKAWIEKQSSPEESEFLDGWPFEQAVLEHMIGVNDTKLSNVGVRDVGLPIKIGIIRPRTMNTPWGSHFRHLWRGPGNETRDHVFDDTLRDLGIDSNDKFNDVLDEITSGHTYQERDLPEPVKSVLNQSSNYRTSDLTRSIVEALSHLEGSDADAIWRSYLAVMRKHTS